MRIESLWIENFRSIQSLRLDGLGEFNIFYGENGAGKSNILAAIDLLFKVMGAWVEDPKQDLAARGGLMDNDFPLPEPETVYSIIIGMRLAAPGTGRRINGWFKSFDFEFEATNLLEKTIKINKAIVDGASLLINNKDGKRNAQSIELFEIKKSVKRFRLLPAVRSLSVEIDTEPDTNLTEADRIAWLLREGRLKQALVEAVTNPDIEVRAGLKRMQKIFTGPPLNRLPFDPIHDPSRHRYELNEIHETSKGEPYAVPVDLAGLGIQQIYYVMAGIFLGVASIIAAEEPEAHLHPRTSGMHLRILLKRVVEEGHIDQLFIATHSNLFDLDPTGYFLVHYDPQKGTIVERRTDFAQLDREVFWEPGPARHALQDMLRYLPAETSVLRRDDGTPITAAEMLVLLQDDHPDAVSFVNDVHATAVRTVQRLASREKRSI